MLERLRSIARRPPPDARVLMVCLGNICRSPMAEGVLRAKLDRAGWGRRIAVDSAGTHAERGRAPDPRAVAAAARRGYDLARLRSRPVEIGDFDRFDFVLAMDQGNLEWLRSASPQAPRARLALLLALGAAGGAPQEVPDPYYGAPEGFERALDLIEAACEAVVEAIRGGGLRIP